MNNAWLITGGTGTFGQAATRVLIRKGVTVRILSRDEKKQADMEAAILEESPEFAENVRYFIGDVRDFDRVARAMDGVGVVVHAAAMKRVEKVQYDVGEAVETNVNGTANVANAAMQIASVTHALFLSSDKACNPVNAYGASKLLGEHVWLNVANGWGLPIDARVMTVLRYGNVVGSRGSLIDTVRNGKVPTLRSDMATRFWIDIDDAVKLAVYVATQGSPGSTYIPLLKSSTLQDAVARAGGVFKYDGECLPGFEKYHEELISSQEMDRRGIDRQVKGLPFPVAEILPLAGHTSKLYVVRKGYGSDCMEALGHVS